MSGFELARRFADTTEALTLSVDAAQRRQGIARRLVQNIIMMIQKGGEKPIFLEVRGGNKPAQNLYLGQGFEAVGGRRAYYVNEDEGRSDALTMRLKIS